MGDDKKMSVFKSPVFGYWKQSPSCHSCFGHGACHQISSISLSVVFCPIIDRQLNTIITKTYNWHTIEINIKIVLKKCNMGWAGSPSESWSRPCRRCGWTWGHGTQQTCAPPEEWRSRIIFRKLQKSKDEGLIAKYINMHCQSEFHCSRKSSMAWIIHVANSKLAQGVEMIS